MDRRNFLQGSLGIAAASIASQGLAQAPPLPSPRESPASTRDVWFTGDTAPADSATMAARLAALAQRDGGDAIDRYLAEGEVEALERAFAELLGKEDCAFLATGTLANNIAVRVLCGKHRRALVQRESHLYRDEVDAPQRLSGINLLTMAPDRAVPTLEEVRTAIEDSAGERYPMPIGAISLESPVRRANGEMVPLARVREIAGVARAHGVRLHLDGARLLLAPPGFDVGAYAAEFDTVYVSLYKYLGAPFGAVLAGSKADITEVRELRRLYGGTLWQGWMPAMLARDALPDFRASIVQAHERAGQLIAALVASGKVIDRTSQDASNIHLLEMPEAMAQAAFERGRQAGVRIRRWDQGVVALFVNTTILRRPVGEYVELFLG
ncbi:threonine aldolase family protein [Luteimonas sp. 22616]|uniref:threonine aldolase family protein n=1 Tax=Luteimonas sp. 22616 TaxID=3453951 RepID=UPI003F8610A4